MYKIKLLSIGKTKETWLESGCQEYLKRLTPHLSLETKWVKSNEQLIQMAALEPFLVCLDPNGEELSSEEFSRFFLKTLEKSGSRLCFIIGGAEGLPQQLKLKKNKQVQISLSRMTFTHQMTRLLLFEQIYRALEIAKGSNYHK